MNTQISRFSFLAIGLVFCFQTAVAAPAAKAEKTAKPAAEKAAKAVKDTTVLKVEDLEVGSGAEAAPGKTLSVHYSGWLLKKYPKKGETFDSSENRSPFKFPLGSGMVIKGWDEGIAANPQGGWAAMKVGGKRRLIIPADKAYGEAGAGDAIPPKSTLVFEVHLTEVN